VAGRRLALKGRSREEIQMDDVDPKTGVASNRLVIGLTPDKKYAFNGENEGCIGRIFGGECVHSSTPTRV
jgi:hypothetical protein